MSSSALKSTTSDLIEVSSCVLEGPTHSLEIENEEMHLTARDVGVNNKNSTLNTSDTSLDIPSSLPTKFVNDVKNLEENQKDAQLLHSMLAGIYDCQTINFSKNSEQAVEKIMTSSPTDILQDSNSASNCCELSECITDDKSDVYLTSMELVAKNLVTDTVQAAYMKAEQLDSLSGCGRYSAVEAKSFDANMNVIDLATKDNAICSVASDVINSGKVEEQSDDMLTKHSDQSHLDPDLRACSSILFLDPSSNVTEHTLHTQSLTPSSVRDHIISSASNISINGNVSDILLSSFTSTGSEGDLDVADQILRDAFVDDAIHSDDGFTVRRKPTGAISTDSRIYNVFTFLDNDSDNEDDVMTNHSDNHNDKMADLVIQSQDSDRPPNEHNDAITARDSPLGNEDVNSSGNIHEPTGAAESTEHAKITETKVKRKIVPNMDLLHSDDIDLAFSPSESGELPDFMDIDEKLTDELDDSPNSPDISNLSVDGDSQRDTVCSSPVEPIPEYTAKQEFQDNKKWRIVEISDRTYRIDMIAIEPYKKVLSHGGYYGDGLNAIVVFTACHLPMRTQPDYHYIMDNLFLYVISTIELLVVDDYMIVYFHAAASRQRLPSLRWLKRCYDMIDRRLRKNLSGLIVVHPTLFLKTILLMTKPFVSSKFSAKMRYVKSLAQLTHLIPTEYIFLPDEVVDVDRRLNPRAPSPTKKFVNH